MDSNYVGVLSVLVKCSLDIFMFCLLVYVNVFKRGNENNFCVCYDRNKILYILIFLFFIK